MVWSDWTVLAYLCSACDDRLGPLEFSEGVGLPSFTLAN